MLKDWVSTRPRTEVTRTQYDEPLSGLSVPGFTQNHLRLRVASTCFYAEWDDVNGPYAVLGYEHATHYSYDIHGNVKTLIQEHPQLGLDGGTIASGCVGCIDHRYKRMDYSYDLISGNVKRVDYQKDQPDRFHHSYTYDADNRITEVETSADGQNWHRDARYFYYPHGPLERVELGEHLVQGMDYAYTLQGWLKGINGDRLNPTTDMGRDGDPSVTSNPNLLAGRDAYALSLGYYGDADYKGIASTWDDDTPGSIVQRPIAPIGASGTANTVAETHKPLYNGNIAHTVNTLQHFGLWDAGNGAQGQVLAQVYHYDQLNRLKKARGFIGLTNDNTWSGVVDAAENRYRSEYEYDANGNIETVERWNASGAARYDSLHYHYHDATNGRRLRNRLYHLQDLAANGVVVSPDPEDLAKTTLAFDGVNPINTSGSTNNYRYDALGNLVSDNREGITNIDWTVAGKVRSVMKASGPTLAFDYGADGQRIIKQLGDPAVEDEGYREHYIRDAQGNIMATYRFTNTIADGVSLKLTERPVYGSSRLGSLRKEFELYDESFDPQAANPMLQVDLNYELTDHLGNVCAVVTGRLLDGNGGGTPKQADLLSAQGYEAFGSLMPGRNYSSDSYRFGFNGKENDNEVHGATGTFQDYGFRMSDTRVGRFISVDPIAYKYPWYSPYQFAGLKPIWAIDLDGLEEFFKTDYRDISGNLYKTVIEMVSPDGARTGTQTVHHTLVQENADRTFTKSYTGSTTGTTNGTNAFGNDAAAAMQRQGVLKLDQNNVPQVTQFATPRPTQVLTIDASGNSVITTAMATSMSLVPSPIKVGFVAELFDANGAYLGFEIESNNPRSISNRELITYGPILSTFDASTNPNLYSGNPPVMDGLIPKGTNAVPSDATQRGGGVQTMPNGSTKAIPVGTNLQSAQGGSGNRIL